MLIVIQYNKHIEKRQEWLYMKYSEKQQLRFVTFID